jgi:hypothetical protein
VKLAKGDGVLAKMQEFTAARLSVSKVSDEEWNFIVDNLIEGYEEEEDAAALPTNSKDVVMTNGEATNGIKEPEVQETIETDGIPTTDSNLLAPETAATSSRPASRAGSKKPGSRANSAQPARANSRARSRTPSARGSVQAAAAVADAGLGSIAE